MRLEQFIKVLRSNGWSEDRRKYCYVKGSWVLVFDTSSWIEVGTTETQRIFDVPVPEKRLEQWTLNLIEHLCKTDEKLREKSNS